MTTEPRPARPEPCPHVEDCAERRSCLGRRCRPVDEHETPGTIFVAPRKWSAAPATKRKPGVASGVQ